MATVEERIETLTYNKVYGYKIELTIEEAEQLSRLLDWGVAIETLQHTRLAAFADALGNKTRQAERSFEGLYTGLATIDKEWPHK